LFNSNYFSENDLPPFSRFCKTAFEFLNSIAAFFEQIVWRTIPIFALRAPRKIDLSMAETLEISLYILNKAALFSIKLN